MVVVCSSLTTEDVVLAVRHFLADRSRRGQRDDLVGREIAFGESGQNLASDIAGRADHRYLETHRLRSPGWSCP